MVERATDPVCGAVLQGPAHDSLVVDGRRYYVCSRACYAALLDTPHRYAGWRDDSGPRRARVRAAAARLGSALHLARVHAV